MHPIPLIHEISLCVICFIKWAWKTLKKGRNVPFSLTMHPVTRIYWTAWLWQIQTTQAQGKLLMHGANAWYWCMVGRVPEFAHYTHTCLARRKQLVSGKNLHGHVSWIRVHYWLHPWTHFIKLFNASQHTKHHRSWLPTNLMIASTNTIWVSLSHDQGSWGNSCTTWSLSR